MDRVEDQVLELIKENQRVSSFELSRASSIAVTGLDSLDLREILDDVESDFRIVISSGNMDEIETTGDLIDLLRNSLG